MRALKKLSPPAVPKKCITVFHLRLFLSSGFLSYIADDSLTGAYQRTLWVAMLLAFHALLRSSEFLHKGKLALWNARTGLARQDVSFIFASGGSVPIAFKLRIKHSKTDVFCHGAEFTFYATNGPLCIVAAVWASYLDGGSRGVDPCGPLFLGVRRKAVLTYKTFTKALLGFLERLNFDPKLYASHSLRSGGATALLAAGYDISYVKIMGRWSSTAFERYLQLDISTRQNIARAMQNVQRETVPFFFDSLAQGAEDVLATARLG